MYFGYIKPDEGSLAGYNNNIIINYDPIISH